jgi:hypothetical protein
MGERVRLGTALKRPQFLRIGARLGHTQTCSRPAKAASRLGMQEGHIG